MNRKFKILSIDGGGLRGIVPLQVIKYIENLTKEPIHKSFDLIAGTSTGGILTCALTLQDYDASIADKRMFDLEKIEKLYKEKGKEIFPPFDGFISKNHNKVHKWFRPQFKIDNLSKILYAYFEDYRITSCLRPIFITSFDIHRNRPLYFTTREASLFHEKNAKLTEICKATTAAPTYFQSHNFNYDGENITCIDGGVIMNNPSIGALIEVLGNPDYKHYNIGGKALNLQNIYILSLGTGRASKILNSSKSKNWGRIKWIKPIIDISTTGAPVKIAHQQMATIFNSNGLNNQYLRINIDINQEYAEMSDSRDSTSEYLLKETNSQIIYNHTMLFKLKMFLKESGILISNN